jgi:glutamate 5-kinase
MSLKYRQIMPDARRVVIKIGSRALVQKTGRPDKRRMRRLVRDMANIHRNGREVVLVTSGAIAAGMEALGMKERPEKMPDQQMVAAVGQMRLMSRYDDLFSSAGCRVGQVLLTRANFHQKIRQTNAKRTVENLLRHGVIPIINENDAVADDEIRALSSFGDNDQLAGLVAKMIRADLLILLTTVDGLREQTPAGRTRRIRYLEEITPKTFEHVGSYDTRLSRGGMHSKLKVAGETAKTGCPVVIANGLSDGIIQSIMRGEDVGTLVVA